MQEKTSKLSRRVAVIQARLSSRRLPGKVLMDLAGLPAVGWSVRAARAIAGIDAVAVATSTEVGDDPLAQWCGANDVTCIRGPLDDVLARYALAARTLDAGIVLRLTADCPLLDPEVCAEVLHAVKDGVAYASNVAPRSFPKGLDCEAFPAAALYCAEEEARLPEEREHVTPYLRNRPAAFSQANILAAIPDLADLRWTLDYPEDYAFLAALAPHLPKGRPSRYAEVLAALDRHPELGRSAPIPAET